MARFFDRGRRILHRLPGIGWRLEQRQALRDQAAAFPGSARYWEERYQSGGTSGAGSEDRLAQFKAEVLNGFVLENRIRSVVEFGCGDGRQLALARYPTYLGVDVSSRAVEICAEQFGHMENFRFILAEDFDNTEYFDLSLSLDVIYHLVEDGVYSRYMETLFDASGRFVIVYSSNYDGAWDAVHVRHRKFTNWIAQNRPEWRLAKFIRNRFPYDTETPSTTSFSDFHIFAKHNESET